MIHFDLPWVFALLPLPLLVWWLLPRARGTSGRALRVPFAYEFDFQSGGQMRRRWRPATLVGLLVWALLTTSAAKPQRLGEAVTLPVSGRDLLMAVDISGSMRLQDFLLRDRRVSRLAATKAVAAAFLSRRVGDRIGLILFGSQAYLQAPLTFDRESVAILLNEAEIGLAGNQTAIGDAIGLAIKRLRERPKQNRVLILLTDGANTSGSVDPKRAAELAAQEGVRIYTIGIGADEVARRSPFGVPRYSPASELDEAGLKQLAALTGGRYFRARGTAELLEIYTELDALEPIEEEEDGFRPVQSLYAWPLAAALLVSSLGLMLIGGRAVIRHA